MGLLGKRKEEHIRRPSSKIVVASGCRGCGVSFVSMLLASGLANRFSVSVTELGDAHFYDALDFETNFLARGFTDYFEKIRAGEQIKIKGREDSDAFVFNENKPCNPNIFEDISWIVRKNRDNAALSAAELFRALYIPKDEFCIFDCSGIDNETSRSLLAEADFPVCVIDPLPSRISRCRDFLENVLVAIPNCILIVNQMNPGVHNSEIKRFLGGHEYFSIASVPQEYIYKAEYNSMSFCRIAGCTEILGKTQDMLSKLFI